MNGQLTLFALLAGAALLIIFFIMYLLAKPFRWLFRLVYNSLIGLLLLWVVNLVGQVVGFHVPINLLTVLIVGFLGVPGLLVVIVFNLLLGG
ncbi:MAG: pro-sigmaK processing inhibitor BofA family protein [Thermoanaerobacteraceae bacterium]|nr:pro-sigmaK processing inhibitor BofA family protein [Thermoanaerobacteraceae bacterium]